MAQRSTAVVACVLKKVRNPEVRISISSATKRVASRVTSATVGASLLEKSLSDQSGFLPSTACLSRRMSTTADKGTLQAHVCASSRTSAGISSRVAAAAAFSVALRANSWVLCLNVEFGATATPPVTRSSQIFHSHPTFAEPRARRWVLVGAPWPWSWSSSSLALPPPPSPPPSSLQSSSPRPPQPPMPTWLDAAFPLAEHTMRHSSPCP
mmetsp:Transcript_26456/g.67106  ORF Transcript_26456/g.67106 Transcript_26456/m.67106 type:complete len:210 (-) Transcript_26456:719-1348(-)